MNFDDGSNPWKNSDFSLQILDVGGATEMYSVLSVTSLLIISLLSLYNLV